MSRSEFKNAILNHCIKSGLQPDQIGYLSSLEENLVEQFSNWPQIVAELDNGNGNELSGKFRAIHSSTALCVNNFAPFKEHMDSFTFVDHSAFDEASFEKKLSTGISTPNLDFYLENDNAVIGIESKFIETIDIKKPNTNLEKYLDRKELAYLPDGFSQVLQHYIKSHDKSHLDVAQLIKHAIGLINQSRSKNSRTQKKAVLVYLYWLPTNWSDFELYQTHEVEISDFSKRIEPFIQFHPMSYLDFWKQYECDDSFGKHIERVKARYSMAI